MKSIFIAAAWTVVLAAGTWGQTTADSAELKRLLNEFLAGAGRNDAVIHDRFWADDLIYTRGTGQRVGKAEIMKSVRSAAPPKADDPKTVYTSEDVRIQQYADAAVVAFKLVGTTETAGKTSVVRFYNTGTFVKRKGEWRAVAWQATRIPDPTPGVRQ